jgi:2,4-dienoyl-CoA reductase-like NADH-dependent reductase (Old Yellow Enzyme family)
MTGSRIFTPLSLPNGTVLSNRLAKAAMEESLADGEQAPGELLCRLYQRWAESDIGLMITGNVMVDRRALTGPGAVVLEDDSQLHKFARWARIAKSGGAKVWMQINHPGRQLYAFLGQQAVGPSAIVVDIPGFSRMFAPPREMTGAEIWQTIERFANSALLAQRAGFDGVQIHAAHGYLISQFLSPLTNKRNDEWGGSLRNRARLLLEIVSKVRSVVRPDFCVAVKLNSADFQRGGFDAGDAIDVVGMLNTQSVDLVELSGGNYEAPAMQGQTRDGRTLDREAYFLEFAQHIAQIANMPLMVTGGIRRKTIAEKVIRKGVSVVGMASAFAIRPTVPDDWRSGRKAAVELPDVKWKNKTLAAAATMSLIKAQLSRMGRGKEPKPNLSPFWRFVGSQLHTRLRARQYRGWIARN